MNSTLLFIVIPALLLSCSTIQKPKTGSSDRIESSHQSKLSEKKCKSKKATLYFRRGFQLQRQNKPEAAIKAYRSCLAVDSSCVHCSYEIGWSYWSVSDWKSVVEVWSSIKSTSEYPDLETYLNQAIDKKRISEGKESQFVQQNVPIGISSKPEDAQVQLKLIARFQQYNRNPTHKMDHFDTDIFSPKSVTTSVDGEKVYVNSLEGFRTVVYDAKNLKKIVSIEHRFTEKHAHLFQESAPFSYFYRNRKEKNFNPNIFLGKPVEAALSHEGRYLWTPYYRRNYDDLGVSPSAIAIIDTGTHEIVRVISTGPISKYVEPSPDGKWMAVSHWGDNSISLISINHNSPKQFVNIAHLHVETPLKYEDMTGDRDKNCGFCLRGMAFTKDSRYLFVARMKGGGIAVFRINDGGGKYLGSVFGFKPTPRDLHITQDGKWLYVSSNISGHVSRVMVNTLIEKAKGANGKRVVFKKSDKNFYERHIGAGARSIRLAFDEQYLFAAINLKSELAVLDAKSLNILAKIPVDSYPVGLDVNSSLRQIWVTSQGRSRNGGNSVSVYKFIEK